MHHIKNTGLLWEHSAVSMLGSLSATSLIVVIGRSNFKKSSAALDNLLRDLHALGHAVCFFESESTRTARWLDERFEHWLKARPTATPHQQPARRKYQRSLIKAALLLARPEKWVYFLNRLGDPHRSAATELQQLLERTGHSCVHLFSHSAGGIVASKVSSHPSVVSLVCFGYPFKHPDKQEEPARTAHLAAVTKPFLIFQGDADEYGTELSSKRYSLGARTVVERLSCGHDYDPLEPSQYQKCTALLQNFYRTSSPIAPAKIDSQVFNRWSN